MEIDPSPPPPPPQHHNDQKIDILLERYLNLLDEYTTLRFNLSRLQTQTFQHLARANFSAERGVRYGADYYDERMQASRRVVVSSSPVVAAAAATEAATDANMSAPVFHIVGKEEDVVVGSSDDPGRGADKESANAFNPTNKNQNEEEEEEKEEEHHHAPDTSSPPPTADSNDKAEQVKNETILTRRNNKNDPLRWFGVLTPMALRQTQACTVQTVEDIIPRLVSVDAAMRQVEIEVRRAKKRRAKADKASSSNIATVASSAEKSRQEGQQQQQQQQQDEEDAGRRDVRPKEVAAAS